MFYLVGHYHGWWRYVTFADLAALLRASIISLLLLVATDHFMVSYQIPRSILLLDCLMSIAVLGILRSGWRLYREQIRPAFADKNTQSAILVGTDDSTGRLAHQIHAHPKLHYRVQGFVATDKSKVGARLGHIPVLGMVDDIVRVARICQAKVVLMTAGGLSGQQLRELMQACEQGDLQLKIIPRFEDRLEGNNTLPIRDINIEDLLRRDPVVLDTQAIESLLEGGTVLVTGAGGSIGSEICRQVLRFGPSSMVLVGRGENRIFHIHRELREQGTYTRLHPHIGDITDYDRMEALFKKYHPDVVFHAAAHKHVPLMEADPGEAIKNNVGGTRNLADLAHRYNVSHFVMISTDKAVNPTSVMGATKQVAEQYVHALSLESRTRFVVTRFGNVLGSEGSVVPIFQEQIRRGGPITVTHPEMTRFFMSIPEASQLVLQAAAMGKGGEIFVLEMGEPVKIVNLANDLMHLSGLSKDSIEIVFSGIRPGEKLYEELFFNDELTLKTAHSKIRVARHRPCLLKDAKRNVAALELLVGERCDEIRQKLQDIVPELLDNSINDEAPKQAPATIGESP